MGPKQSFFLKFLTRLQQLQNIDTEKIHIWMNTDGNEIRMNSFTEHLGHSG